MVIPIKWTVEEHNYLVQLRQKGLPWKIIAEKMTARFEKQFRAEQCRARWRMNRHLIETIPDYKESIEIKSDGSQVSDKLVELSEKEMKDPKYILLAHGYDPDKWDVVNVKASRWHYRDKETPHAKISYASKLTVKPKKEGLNFDKLLEQIEKVKPFEIKHDYVDVEKKKLLEISQFDQHFGISDYEYYKPTQERIIDKIRSRRWEQILITIGSDMFHNNNHRGQTANGTQIEQVDMNKAWTDAEKYFFPIMDESLKNSNHVYLKYVKGNHDETLAWTFVKMLKRLYPDAIVDDSFQERKIHIFGEIFIGFTHGDKGRKDLHNIFPVEFPLEWAQAKTREIHTGHYHREDGKDVFGMMVRTLATRNKTDQWHKDNGFIGNHKRFMLFQYNEEELEAIYYV